MDTPVINFTDPGLSAESATLCDLNVVVGTGGISMLISGKSGKTFALKALDFGAPGRDFSDSESRIRMAFGAETLFLFPFSSVHCALFNGNATLVPRRLFDTDNLASYFKILLPAAEYEYGYDILPEFECFLVYAAEPAIIQMCRQYFPQGKISHLATPLLKSMRNLAPANNYGVFVNLRNQTAQIAVFDRRNLLFYNAFQYVKASDLLYFVLLVYDQFRLDANEIPLHASGSLTEDSENFRLLYRYVNNIRFATLPENILLPPDAGNLPDHFWFDLCSLSQLPISITHSL